MTSATTAVGLAVALLAVTGSGVSAQGVSVGSCDGVVRGDLGITGYECRGPECGTRLVHVAPPAPGADPMVQEVWRYSTEPAVAGVRRGSPLDGVVRRGDRIVSVDGAPITTLEGSRALHMVEPGERVRLAYRRDGELRETEVEAGSRCVDEPEEPRPAPPAPPPEYVVQRPRGQISPPEPGRPGRLSGDVISTRVPNRGVRLGMSFQCGNCVILTDEDGGVRWSFSAPIEIVRVEEDGPADRAGLRSGDLLRSIGGHPIESREGGEAWGSLTPGEPVRVVVSRPDGSFTDVELVPEQRTNEGATVTASGRVQYAPPAPPDPATAPVRYTGVLDDVAVEVRGAPVTVEKDEGAGTVTIYTGDNVIIIRTGRDG